MNATNRKIRVLVVDDSASVRQTLCSIIDAAPDMEVMATAGDPFIAAQRINEEVPNVLVLDVEMPRMDGITFLRKIMAQRPIPTVLCSTLLETGSETLLEALDAGAVDVILKPRIDTKQFLNESQVRIWDSIRAAAKVTFRGSRVATSHMVQKKLTADVIMPPPAPARALTRTTDQVVCIGASTGGTESLREVLTALAPNSSGIVIVQHMPERFTAAFAHRLVAAVQRGRPVGHPGRDCFGIWFEEIESPLGAAAELLALAHVLGQDLVAGETKLTPEVTAGIAVFPDDATDAASLLTRAYAAIPQPGQHGAPKVALFCGETATAARNRFALEQGLRHAIDRDELILHFQPVVDLSACRVVGAEALLRWRSPELGLVPPGEFIPVVEQSGMMEEFGMWVLDAACKEAAEWEQRGLTGMKMAVNLSARQIHQGTLLRMVVRTLERHGLQPQALELELTESAALVDDEGTRILLGELRELGISVAIDDFGTGYSSLSNLRKLPFSKLKIDREFVSSVNDHRGNHAICGSLVELARGLGIAVLAEGAETLEEVETLHGLGCSMFQGYFFSRPLPAADFATTIADPQWLTLLASPVHREIASLSRRVTN